MVSFFISPKIKNEAPMYELKIENFFQLVHAPPLLSRRVPAKNEISALCTPRKARKLSNSRLHLSENDPLPRQRVA